MADVYSPKDIRDIIHNLQKGKETLVEMLQYRMMASVDGDVPISNKTIGTMKNITEDMIKFRKFFEGAEDSFVVKGVMIELDLEVDFFKRMDIFIDTMKEIVIRDINTYEERRKQQGYGWW